MGRLEMGAGSWMRIRKLEKKVKRAIEKIKREMGEGKGKRREWWNKECKMKRER